MSIINLSFNVPFDESGTYDAGTVGKFLQDLGASIIEASIPDGSITAVKLASDSVITVKIADLQVTTAKLANDAVTYAKLQNISAGLRLLGRGDVGAGDATELAITAYVLGLFAAGDEATLQAALNLEPGTDVQAFNANLAALAALTLAADKIAYATGAGALALADFPAAGRALAATGESKDLLSTDNLQTGTSYTIDVAGADSDRGRMIECNNASGITVTLPNSAPVGFYCSVYQGGAGQITFTPASGATRVNRQSHTKSAGQWAGCGLKVWRNSGGNTAQWVLTGDTAA